MNMDAPPERSVRYARILASGEEEAVSRAEAEAAGAYLAYHLLGSIVERVEVVDGGRPSLVVYHDRSWPDPQLLTMHQDLYGNCPLAVQTPVIEVSGWRVRTDYHVDGQGTLRGYDQLTLDARGEPTREERRNGAGELIEIVEYGYDADGELSHTRVLGPDGTVLDEIL